MPTSHRFIKTLYTQNCSQTQINKSVKKGYRFKKIRLLSSDKSFILGHILLMFEKDQLEVNVQMNINSKMKELRQIGLASN